MNVLVRTYSHPEDFQRHQTQSNIPVEKRQISVPLVIVDVKRDFTKLVTNYFNRRPTFTNGEYEVVFWSKPSIPMIIS